MISLCCMCFFVNEYECLVFCVFVVQCLMKQVAICPSRRGPHKILVLCNNFGNENYIIFNMKNT